MIVKKASAIKYMSSADIFPNIWMFISSTYSPMPFLFRETGLNSMSVICFKYYFDVNMIS